VVAERAVTLVPVRLILIRHGRTASNTAYLLDTGYPGAPLDDVGLEQAEALVGRLAGEPLDAIMASDLTRARQTAAPLAAARGLEVIAHPGVREIYAGDADMGVEYLPYVQTIQSWVTDPAARIPGGESGAEFIARYDGAIAELAAAGHSTVAVVSHGAALRTWLGARVPGLRPEDLGPGAFANTAYVVLDDAAGEWRVERWDAPPHLSP